MEISDLDTKNSYFGLSFPMGALVFHKHILLPLLFI